MIGGGKGIVEICGRRLMCRVGGVGYAIVVREEYGDGQIDIAVGALECSSGSIFVKTHGLEGAYVAFLIPIVVFSLGLFCRAG